MANFSKIFKQLRLENKYTQQELAKKIGVSRSAIGMYETGERQPDFETLEVIADFFNVDMDFLLGRNTKVHTIAAHHDGEKWTDEELNEIEEFKKFVLSKRINR